MEQTDQKSKSNVSQVERMSPREIYKRGLSISKGYGFWDNLNRKWPEGRISKEELVEIYVRCLQEEKGLSDPSIIIYGDWGFGEGSLDELGEMADYYISQDEAEGVFYKHLENIVDATEQSIIEHNLDYYDINELKIAGYRVIDLDEMTMRGCLILANRDELKRVKIKQRQRNYIIFVDEMERKGVLIKNRGILGKKYQGVHNNCGGRIYGNKTANICLKCDRKSTNKIN